MKRTSKLLCNAKRNGINHTFYPSYHGLQNVSSPVSPANSIVQKQKKDIDESHSVNQPSSNQILSLHNHNLQTIGHIINVIAGYIKKTGDPEENVENETFSGNAEDNQTSKGIKT